MPQDRTPIDHGLAHPQPERGRIPEPLPRPDEDLAELVNNQDTFDDSLDPKPEDAGGQAGAAKQPD